MTEVKAEPELKVALRPETRRYIDEQVKNGHFPNAEAVIEAAIAEMQTIGQAESDLGAEEADCQSAIDEARAQLNRGEGIPLEAVRAHWNKQLHGG